MSKTPCDVHKTFCKDIYPTICVRCNEMDTAEGYYFGRSMNKHRIGICRKHKKHGGSRIYWYNEKP
jgi:hypothetical protein